MKSKIAFLVFLFCSSIIFFPLTSGADEPLKPIDEGFTFIEDLNYNFKELEKRINTLRGMKDIPVGTIICSHLKPNQFITEAMKGIWVPADGRDTPPNSSYTEQSLPDLRGVFIRGWNNFQTFKGPRKDDYADNAYRNSNGYQGDATKIPNDPFRVIDQQAVTVPVTVNVAHPAGGTFARGGAPGTASPSITIPAHGHSLTGGDDETRPKNLALYYYIKIK